MLLFRTRYCYGLVLILLGLNSLGYAHTLKIFALVEGDHLSGYVYFPGGGRVQNIRVNIESLAINQHDQVVTDSQGEFTYPVQHRTDYLLTVNTEDGHRAEYTVKANELSETVPANSPTEVAATSSSQVPPTFSNAELTASLEKTVSHQLRPLREQLEQYEAKIRLHDILGGIGYIFGTMGLIFYFGTRKR